MSEVPEIFLRLGLATGIGLLFGLERGWRAREEPAGARTAGIRTFSITGLLGGIIAVIAQSLSGIAGAILIAVSFVAYSAAMTAFCLQENRSQRTYSATTWVAATLTFTLGVFAVLGDMRAAAASAVAGAGLLALREPLHAWVKTVTWAELRSILVLLSMTFIGLPIMPASAIGPFGGFNPREVWMIAIILAATSFAGYVAVKHLGPRHGVLLAGAVGGLVSSTAVTISNARRAASGEGSVALLAAGVAMASGVMYGRVAAIALAINPALLSVLALPLLAASAAAFSYALVRTRRVDEVPPQVSADFRNPLSLLPVLTFAMLLGVVMIAARAVNDAFGSGGVIGGAALVGLIDVDAITVSLAHMAPQQLAIEKAATAILAAVLADTISKIAIALAVGRARFTLHISFMATACIIVGAAAYYFAATRFVP